MLGPRGGAGRRLPAYVRLAALSLATIVCQPSHAEPGRVDALLSAHPDLPSLLASSPLREAGELMFFYTNLRGAERAMDAPSPPSLTNFLQLDDDGFARWSASMSRIVMHGVATGAAYETLIRGGAPGLDSVFRALPRTLGIDWFTIDELTAFGVPPEWLVIAFAQIPAGALEGAAHTVEKAGYSRNNAYGIDGWYRNPGPGTSAPADRSAATTADPFAIGAPAASRLLLAPGRLAYSASPTLIELTAATWAGRSPGFGETGRFQVALSAASDGAGSLVQAFVTTRQFTADDVATGHLGPYSSFERRAEYVERLTAREPPLLPRYEAVFLADRQEVVGETVLLGLVYRDRADAVAAGAALPRLFDAYAPASHRQKLLAAEELDRASYLFSTSADGPYAAVIELRRRPSAGGRGKPGKTYRMLLENLQLGDIAPLATVER